MFTPGYYLQKAAELEISGGTSPGLRFARRLPKAGASLPRPRQRDQCFPDAAQRGSCETRGADGREPVRRPIVRQSCPHPLRPLSSFLNSAFWTSFTLPLRSLCWCCPTSKGLSYICGRELMHPFGRLSVMCAITGFGSAPGVGGRETRPRSRLKGEPPCSKFISVIFRNQCPSKSVFALSARRG